MVDLRPGPRAHTSASQPRVTTTVGVTIGTFNYGVMENMLVGKNSKKHLSSIARVWYKLVDEGDLDLCFGCEVGGHKQGFKKAHLNFGDLVAGCLGEVLAESDMNYCASWADPSATQPGECKLLLQGTELVVLSSARLEPQLGIKTGLVDDCEEHAEACA